jgi:hypothetical protein
MVPLACRRGLNGGAVRCQRTTNLNTSERMHIRHRRNRSRKRYSNGISGIQARLRRLVLQIAKKQRLSQCGIPPSDLSTNDGAARCQKYKLRQTKEHARVPCRRQGSPAMSRHLSSSVTSVAFQLCAACALRNYTRERSTPRIARHTGPERTKSSA